MSDYIPTDADLEQGLCWPAQGERTLKQNQQKAPRPGFPVGAPFFTW